MRLLRACDKFMINNQSLFRKFEVVKLLYLKTHEYKNHKRQ